MCPPNYLCTPFSCRPITFCRDISQLTKCGHRNQIEIGFCVRASSQVLLCSMGVRSGFVHYGDQQSPKGPSERGSSLVCTQYVQFAMPSFGSASARHIPQQGIPCFDIKKDRCPCRHNSQTTSQHFQAPHVANATSATTNTKRYTHEKVHTFWVGRTISEAPLMIGMPIIIHTAVV